MIVRDWVRETDDQAVNPTPSGVCHAATPLSEVRASSRR